MGRIYSLPQWLSLHFCLYVLSTNIKLRTEKKCKKTTSTNSSNVLVTTSLFSLFYECFLIEAMHTLCGTLG